MMGLSGKKILVAVTAGISAYKAPFLVRLLMKAGAEVQVLMTSASKDFVTPLTLSTLSKKPVYTRFTDKNKDGEIWNNHVELGMWADMMLIVPATANTLSKMCNGQASNLVLATYLSARCPVYFAPAMDLDMYKHPSVKKNIETLQSYGNIMIPPTYGDLASGLVGQGRMQEPKEILEFIQKDIKEYLPLKGKKTLITAGSTYEAIDPVRFIGNYSSGKMGIALAHQALDLGAEVILITGPIVQPIPDKVIHKEVVSAEQMYQAVQEHYEHMDIVIAAAAVADYTPVHPFKTKIKKKKDRLSIDLKPTRDILIDLGRRKKQQILIGFALETENEIHNAQSKLERKNLDFIVLNSLNDKGAGFLGDTNKITLIDAQQNITSYPLQSKKQVSIEIFIKIQEILKNVSTKI